MINIFRIIEKEDSEALRIGVEFQMFNKKKDAIILQKIVRGLLSQHGIETSFGLDENGGNKSEFDYEPLTLYSLMYTSYHDKRPSNIALAHPKMDSVKDFKDLMVGKDL